MKNQYYIVPSDVNEDYFLWLCLKIDGRDPDNDYISNLRIMHNNEFNKNTAVLVGNDINRISDGVALRTEYENDSGNILEGMNGRSCSILELVVALAYRMSSDLGVMSPEEWFWEMADNLGITNPSNNKYEIRTILRIFRRRKYEPNGFGGLFPLNFYNLDQRKVEIWVQMQAYFSENYG